MQLLQYRYIVTGLNRRTQEMGENKRRDWIFEKMNKAFKESMSEKDYQVVMGLSKWYAPYFIGESKNSDSFLINIAYQIGKMEGKKSK